MVSSLRSWTAVPGLAVALVVAFGCGRGKAPSPPPSPRASVVVAPGVNPVWRGALGAVLAALESRAGVRPEARVVASPERVENVLVHEAGGGARVVICLGPECATAVYTVAPSCPTVRFVVVPGERATRNVAAVSFAENEAAYVAAAVAPALAKKPRVLVVDGPGCGDDLVTALSNGLRVRSRGAELEQVGRAAVLEGGVDPAGVTMAVLCPGPEGGALVDRFATAGVFLVAFDPALLRNRAGLRCGLIEEDLPEALVRVTVDLLERNEPGSVYAFDVGSGVVRFRLCPGVEVPPEVRQAVAEARDEVVAGIAEIEILDMRR